jgi:hypothetical protein
LDARDAEDLLLRAVDEALQGRRVAVFCVREGGLEGGEVIVVKSGIEPLQVDETPEEKTGGGKEHERERGFDNDESGRKAPSVSTRRYTARETRGAATPGFAAGDAQRGQYSEEKPGAQGNRDGEEKNMPVGSVRAEATNRDRGGD